MKTLISHVGAKVRGRTGERKHRKIVDNVFATRDALEASSASMQTEIQSNDNAIHRLRARNADLRRNASHAQTVASRLAEMFLPR